MVAGGDCSWQAPPTPGLQCILAETVARGGVDVGVTKSVAGGEKHEASGPHITTLDLRVISAWSRRWSLRAPPSEIVTGGGEGGLSSCEAVVTSSMVVVCVSGDWRAISTS